MDGSRSRVMLKLSGESLSGEGGRGLDPERVRWVGREIAEAARGGVEVAVMIGAGNLVRGGALAGEGLVGQATADGMGMLGTVINALALESAVRGAGVDAVCLTAFPVEDLADRLTVRDGTAALGSGKVVVIGGGTGRPFFTTDTAAALRAAELGCGRILKATKVDGVYASDPKRDAGAERFERLTMTEAIERRLGVMDQTALALCRERGLEVVVFDFAREGNIARAARGESIGTVVEGV